MVAGQVSSPQTQTRAQQASSGTVTPARAVRATRRCSTERQGDPKRGEAGRKATRGRGLDDPETMTAEFQSSKFPQTTQEHRPSSTCPVDPFRPNDGATAHLRWGFLGYGPPESPKTGIPRCAEWQIRPGIGVLSIRFPGDGCPSGDVRFEKPSKSGHDC
ncbi:hypothetical protein CMUS01_10541 [Colletotrichum musicola]|uniref:Uncharacterized protein n=1 Tax=Colletotrichum musicola TaxID=2175873 RepID=A0A8H6N8X3_9PEZI|nr:hypothetical protein CMUS01_10541 [Colletotrichum musicola]